MQPLAGRTIALPEARELDKLAELVAEAGGTALRCPLVAIRDAPDPAPAEAWLRALAAGELDDLVFLTGEGLRRLLATAERLGIRDAVVAALARARKVTRGPKPARALHELGLGSDLAAPVPTSAGVIEALAALDLRGRRVGVQLYGEEPNRPLVEALERAGATVRTVAPYVYASAADGAAVVSLIDALDARRVDAIAFTSASQVDRLFQVAAEAGAEARLRAALPHARVAAIGPIVVETLERHGARADVVPEKGFVMRRLVNALADALGPKG
ncbi:MAG TPA: uroporphyrinogen-III synthase [Polyangia bacterium]|nr:uroporphyrinogen-III synthase [Polyangia bacterium]